MKNILKTLLCVSFIFLTSCTSDEKREQRKYCYQVTYNILCPDSTRQYIDYTYCGKAEVRFDKNRNYWLYDDLGDYTITKSAYPIIIINQIKVIRPESLSVYKK